MSTVSARGFTFIELLMALILMGIITTSIYKLLNNNQRVYREQGTRIDLNQNVRAAASILPYELRELDASDGDIVAMGASSLTYRSMKDVYFLCQAPNTAALQVTVSASPWFGSQALDVTQDSFVVFAENNPASRMDDAWLHANATASSTGTACPLPNTASITLTLAGITAAQLGGVAVGAPIRGFKDVRVLSYQDANGAWWIGSSNLDKPTGTWSSTEPIVGPITSTGFAFTYYDATGAVTAVTTSVARIAISVTGQTSKPVIGTGGALVYATSNVVDQVALRNNKRY